MFGISPLSERVTISPVVGGPFFATPAPIGPSHVDWFGEVMPPLSVGNDIVDNEVPAVPEAAPPLSAVAGASQNCWSRGNPAGAEVTVNPAVRVALTLPGSVTVTSRAPVAAAAPIVIESEMLVAVSETMDAVTPVPLKVTDVAVERFVPVTVALKPVEPCAPAAGLIEDIAGVTEYTLKATDPEPAGVCTVSCPAATGAVRAIVSVAVSEVLLFTVTALTAMPVSEVVNVVAPATKFVPVSVTLTVTP